MLIHHGITGTIDPRAVFSDPREWHDPDRGPHGDPSAFRLPEDSLLSAATA